MIALQAAVVALALSGAGETVLLDFHADWCGPCQQMNGTVGQLTARGFPVRKVNIDQEKALAARYKVSSIPCFVMVADGQEIDREVGVVSLARLEQMLQAAGVARPSAGSTPQSNSLANSSANSRPSLGQSEIVQFPATLSEAPLNAQRLAAPLAPIANPPSATQEETQDPALARFVACSARIKIDDGNGLSVGSGTIIDSREGEALILTCAHIFRDSQGKGKITVDLFSPGAPKGNPGRLISYDPKSDVGLLSIRPGVPVVAARIAPASHTVRKNDQVVNVGCSGGDDPTARGSRITAIDKFVGSPNLQVAGQPVQGRSGGGLFTTSGLVIGVCNAADPTDDEGLYAALTAVHAELDRAGLGEMCANPVTTSPAVSSIAASETPSLPERMPDVSDLRKPAGMRQTSAAVPAAATNAAPAAVNNLPALAPAEAAAIARLQQLGPGAEVIFIVKPHPNSKGEPIVIEKPSPALLQHLSRVQGAGANR
jgi:thiol-disulfide isomerase/thioredoxin